MGPLGDLLHLITDPHALLTAFGSLAYLGLFAVVFAETGLFVGFFLPGDSLLFAAGLFASLNEAPHLDLPLVAAVCVSAAILGNLAGFLFGRHVGRRLYARPESRFFRREHLLSAERFYEKHGGKTIVLARFMPFIRTFAPIVGGASVMPLGRFAIYSVVGGILWGVGLPAAGYALGRTVPDIDRYLLPIIVLIVAVSLSPAALQVVRSRRARMSEAPSVVVPQPVPGAGYASPTPETVATRPLRDDTRHR